MPNFKYTKQCQHIHVSGRRCAGRFSKKAITGKDRKVCKTHESEFCKECVDMMTTFAPLKGWSHRG